MEGKEARRPLLLALAVPSMALAVGAVEELATVAREEVVAAAGGGWWRLWRRWRRREEESTGEERDEIW
jgi:hypothetical protein